MIAVRFFSDRFISVDGWFSCRDAPRFFSAPHMSYRSIKKILGENSLERKCRILFGICMLILIASSFYAVLRVTEELVRKSNREIANESILTEFMRIHMVNRIDNNREYDAMFSDMAKSYVDPNAKLQTVTLDESVTRMKVNSSLVQEPELVELLRPIAERFREHQDRLHELGMTELSSRQSENSSLIPSEERLPDTADEVDPQLQEELNQLAELSNLKRLGSAGLDFTEVHTNNNQYNFFKPILFSKNCIACHGPQVREADGTVTRLNGEAALNASPTMFFVKYSVPLESANQAINNNRAILLATAIITAFLSTGALYVIMRYVIVKPLQHLRSVSEEVSQGNLKVRTALNTGDEFEQLSKSFNRMLRYISDAQSALQSANDDLERQGNEQAQLAMKLYELNQIKSDFLHNMSHELRTPLNSIIGFSEVLADVDDLNDKQRGFARNIQKSGKSLLDLINDILDLAKLEAGKTDVTATEFQLVQVAEDVRAMIGKMASDKRIDLLLEIEPGFEKIGQDPVKIRQIFTNLMSNAIKFTPEGGRVKVSIANTDPGWFAIEVEDTGVGISESDQQIIFEKFRQGTLAAGSNLLTRQHEGTGLGLSIVKELCILMGGSVTVESVVGKGSTFRVALPRKYVPRPAAFESKRIGLEFGSEPGIVSNTGSLENVSVNNGSTDDVRVDQLSVDPSITVNDSLTNLETD